MKTKSNLLNQIRAVKQPIRLKPALRTLALAAAILGGSACSDPDHNRDNNNNNDNRDSNHPGNHGNHGNHMN